MSSINVWLHYIVYAVLFAVQYSHQQQQQAIPKIQILGLFTLTKCQPEKEFRCKNALLNEKRMVAFQKSTSHYSPNLLCTKDIANSTKILVNTILPIVEEDPNRQIECRGHGVYDNKIKRLIAITHVSFHLTRLVSSLLLLPESNSISLLISITDRPMYPAYFLDHPSAVYSFEAGFGIEVHQNMIKLKNQFNVSYYGILNIHTNHTQKIYPIGNTAAVCQNDPKSLAMCYYATENPDDCIKELDVDVNNITKIAESTQLLEQNNITFVLLSGDSQSLQSYIQHANINFFTMRKIIYVAYVTSIKSHLIPSDMSYYSWTVLIDFPGAVAINRLMFYILDFQHSLLVEDFYWSFLLASKQFQDFLKKSVSCSILQLFDKHYVCGSPVTLDTIAKIPFWIRKQFVSRIVSDKRVYNALIKVWKRIYYIQNINYKELIRQQIYNPSYALQTKPYCELKKPTCHPGYQLAHSFYKGIDWTKNFGWNCQTCPESYFKRSKGNMETCIKCLYPNVTNTNQTLCYDPYLRVQLSLTDLTSIGFLITPSAIMLLSVIATLVLFIVKKDTPIVRSSNRHMTVVQLVAHAFLFVIPNVIFFLPLSRSICMTRQIVLGFVFSITISINISKSQKLFMIVNKKIRMTKSEILMTNASEWIIILSVLCVDALLHALTITNKPVTIETKYHDVLLIKEYYCSNNIMIYIQLLLASFLAVCNGIQGFRARHIPSQYRETNHVIYSSFVSFVVLVASTATYFSQTEERKKELIVLAVTLILNSVHFVLLYGYKMFIMIFRPQLNTSLVFAQKRMEKISLETLKTR